MELIDKAAILSDFIVEYEDSTDAPIALFMIEYALGLDYCFGLSYGHILSLSAEGERVVEDTWSALLSLLNVEDKEYDSLRDLALEANIQTDSILIDLSGE